MKYIVLIELLVFLVCALPAVAIWFQRRPATGDDVIDQRISIIFSTGIGIILLLTLSGWWMWDN
jgi:hypothetical protein